MCSCDGSSYGATDCHALPRLNIISMCFQRRLVFELVDLVNLPHPLLGGDGPINWGVDYNKMEEGGFPPLMSWLISRIFCSQTGIYIISSIVPWLSRIRWHIMVLLSLHTCVGQFLIISLSWLLSPNMHILSHWSKAELQWKFSSFILFHIRLTENGDVSEEY